MIDLCFFLILPKIISAFQEKYQVILLQNKMSIFCLCFRYIFFIFRDYYDINVRTGQTLCVDGSGIPNALQKLDLGRRESSRSSTIASRPILEILGDLRSSTPEALAQPKFQFFKCVRYSL